MDEPLDSSTALPAMNAAVQALPPYPGHFAGRGIVIPGGGIRYFTCAWVCINMLRRLGCTLPIEVWHLGPDEMHDSMRRLIEPLGVACVDALEARKDHPARILNGWELKPYAILHSRFREVLLLDADNVPVVDPTFLFDTPQFRAHGAIFWPDYGHLAPEREVWSLTGVPYRDEPEFETGQIVVDKQRCWRELCLTMWMNEHSDFWYRHIHGDKETFHLAWRKLGTPYAMPETPIENLADVVMCQHDFQGRRVFQHRNLAKWSPGGGAANRRIPGFWFEEECLGFLHELRSQWNVVTCLAGASSEHDRIEMSLVAGHRFHYIRIGYDHRLMRFEPGGTISDGAAGREVFWWVRNGELYIAGEDGTLTCRLSKQPDRTWSGRWLAHERMPVQLRPFTSRTPCDGFQTPT